MKPYYDEAGITIYHGDCREVLPTLEPVDLVLTDPPYGIEADKAKARSSIRDNDKWPDNAWDKATPSKEVFALVLAMAPRVAIWGGNFFTHMLPSSSGWLAWIKPEAETGFSLADLELCWTNQPIAARCKTLPRRDGNLHPTQKPVALMTWTMGKLRAKEGETILDPFMGSGTTLRAAKDAGLKAIGIEISEAYCEIAAKRMAQGVFAFEETG